MKQQFQLYTEAIQRRHQRPGRYATIYGGNPMKLTEIQHLESLAAKNAAINVSAKTLLELREVLLWARRAYNTLSHISNVSEWNAAPLLESAPAEVKGDAPATVEQPTPATANRTPEQLEHADRLVWTGIQNARKAEARRAAIVRGKYK